MGSSQCATGGAGGPLMWYCLRDDERSKTTTTTTGRRPRRMFGNVWDHLAYTVILKIDDDKRRRRRDHHGPSGIYNKSRGSDLEWSQSLISIWSDDTNSKSPPLATMARGWGLGGDGPSYFRATAWWSLNRPSVAVPVRSDAIGCQGKAK